MANSEQEFYAIVVNVPEAKEICFIATPFAKEFDAVFQAVVKAADGLGLQGIRTDQTQSGVDFLQDIVNGIRSARIVVAVCSPEPTGKANPNVLYELGMAHALGKPTIILTSDYKTLPSDIYTKYAIKYDPITVNPSDIDREMRNTLKRSDLLTDSDWRQHGIWVAHERQLMLLQPEFWHNFRCVLSFATIIHDEIQRIDTAHTDDLVGKIENVVFEVGEEVKRKRIREFITACRGYLNYFGNVTQMNLFNPLPNFKSAVADAFAYLLNNADAETRKQIRLCEGFYNNIDRRLGEYEQENGQLIADTRGDLVTQLQDGQTATQMRFAIMRLSNTTKALIVDANRMIVNLIEIIRADGG
jgi:nucleoside 2-deoxyribosyltransferase